MPGIVKLKRLQFGDPNLSWRLKMANGTKVYKNYINGEWVTSATGKTFENRNPADRSEEHTSELQSH